MTFMLRRFWRAIVLAAIVGVWSAPAHLSAYYPGEQVITAPVALDPSESVHMTEVYQRLLEAESRLAALEELRNAELQAQNEKADCSGPFHLLSEYWRSVGDPEIAIAYSQVRQPSSGSSSSSPKKWYEKLGLRGYTQVRINEVLHREPGSALPQHVGDRSVQDNQEFFIRRARLILFGDVSDHMYIYLQPDFAITPPGSSDGTHFVQLRDWYADLYLDTTKVHRVRLGQSKIPYGWENMQSSSNRLPLDRNDALNSAARNERDLGVFYYWTPEPAQDFFKDVMDQGLKGSGNYGVFGLGAYNGQGGSFVEQNDNLHVISRLTVPMILPSGQFAEVGVQGYTGRYVVLSSAIRPLGVGAAARPLGTLETGDTRGIRDERIAVSGIWYPQPLGFQSEWTVGRGPGLNDAQTEVVERALYGGYAMTMYRYETECHGILFPFARWSYYKGGYKAERNAPFVLIDEWEVGCEWQLNPQMEFTGMYTITDRTNTTARSALGDVSYRQFEGDLLRFQFQINF